MDQKIVFSEKLSKADTLILKNLEADIKDVSSRPPQSNGHASGIDNGHTKAANGSTPVPLFPTACLVAHTTHFAKRCSQAQPLTQRTPCPWPARRRPPVTRRLWP